MRNDWNPARSDPVFEDAVARARTLHLAEGVLVGLRRCAPENAIAELVSVAGAAGLSTSAVARELVTLVSGAANQGVESAARTVVHEQWGGLIGQDTPVQADNT